MRNLWSLFLVAVSGKVLLSIFSLVPKKPTEGAMFYELMWLQILALTFFKVNNCKKDTEANKYSVSDNQESWNPFLQLWPKVFSWQFCLHLFKCLFSSIFFFFSSFSTKWLIAPSKQCQQDKDVLAGSLINQ